MLYFILFFSIHPMLLRHFRFLFILFKPWHVRHVRILRNERMCGKGQGKWKLPVLAVLPVVVVSTLTSVTMFAERFAHTAGRVFTRIEQARIHAVAPKVTWHTATRQTINTFYTWVRTNTHTRPRWQFCSLLCIAHAHMYSVWNVIWYINSFLWIAIIWFFLILKPYLPQFQSSPIMRCYAREQHTR